MTKTYQMETFSCPSCVKKIESMLKATAGISESEVLFNSSRIKVAFDEGTINSDAIKGKIDALGFTVLSEK